ncbi:MAG: hypothetical protein ABJH28_10250 [Paraglaciecola sp.]|uniref:hypothetical protein n=1 Tax=Paraglaciecola sp. TaxID=1920173 RepID=UPI003263B316
MSRKTITVTQTDKQNSMPKAMKLDIQTMLKAAAIMPDDEAMAHVREQAGLIFDKYEPTSLAAIELQLAELMQEQERIKAELNDKRDERKKLPRFIADNSDTSQKDKSNG